MLYLNYLIDPVLRGPTLGCMLICFSISLMGVIVYLRKESLIGESLSHAAYPGIIVGLFMASLLEYTYANEFEVQAWILAGAFTASSLGYGVIYLLVKKLKIRPDSALCLVLSCFFGIGMVLASPLQSLHASLFKEVQNYLFGQVATLTDDSIWIYTFFSLANIAFISCFSKEIQLLTFDKNYAKTLGMRLKGLDITLLIIAALNLVLGMRSVGIVLISAMLIAPAVAARQFTHKITSLFLLSGFLGMASSFLGVILSVELSTRFSYGNARFVMPTGPTIVLVASGIALFSLLFAPERGCLYKWYLSSKSKYDQKTSLKPGKKR
jgi:manganese/zinc/iron transport system permease protein